MRDGASSDAFDQLYDAHRDRLYRALVLATDDRDLAMEAVDGGFGAQRRRILRRRLPDPAADVLRRALDKVERRPGGEIRGFRLPDAHIGADGDRIVAAIRDLDLIDRIVLINRHYLEWATEATAIATGLDADAVVLRARSATAKVAASLDVSPEEAADRLGTALPTAAAAVAVPLSRRETVRSESTAQRIGAAVGGLVGVIVVVGGTVIGVNALANSAPAGPAASGTVAASTEGGTEGAATGTGIAVAAIDIETVEWIETGLPIQQGELTAATAGPDGIVAIGTNYGGNTQSMLAMTSETGIDWTAEELPLAGNSSGWISSMS